MNSQQANDLERFRNFSDGYLSFDNNMQLVIDARYSLLPNEASPLWGIIINPDKDFSEHAEWWENRTPSKKNKKNFLTLLMGATCQSLS